VDGPNGSGKTTLLRILAGLERNYSGTVDSPKSLQLRYIPTEVNDLLMPWYSVRRNAHVLLDHDGNGDEIFKQFLSQIQDLFNGRTSTIIDQPAHRLSAGERATVAVACALAAKPSALLLDETLAHMGKSLLDRVILAINQFAADGGLVIIVGHHLPPSVKVTSEIIIEYPREL
jgi:ABC-type multidrug transport system ATPase subunit